MALVHSEVSHMRKKFLAMRAHVFLLHVTLQSAVPLSRKMQVWEGTILHIKANKDDVQPGREVGLFQ